MGEHTDAHTKHKVLITGANGFVGSNLTKILSQDPTLEVFAMVRPNAPVNFLPQKPHTPLHLNTWKVAY